MLNSKILVIDDSATIRKIMQNILVKAGFTDVHLASSGEIGLEALQNSCLLGSKKFDLVISDWHMDKMSGIELIQEIRKDVELDSLLFIMVTSISTEEGIVPALQAGVTGYIQKPFSEDVIKEKVFKVLERAKKN